jgi:hypothetical protein
VREEVTGGWTENCIMRSFLIMILHQYYYHNQKKDEMGETCSMHGRVRNINLNGRHHLKALSTDGRITFKWNLKD